jgi:hypothetical protein
MIGQGAMMGGVLLDVGGRKYCKKMNNCTKSGKQKCLPGGYVKRKPKKVTHAKCRKGQKLRGGILMDEYGYGDYDDYEGGAPKGYKAVKSSAYKKNNRTYYAEYAKPGKKTKGTSGWIQFVKSKTVTAAAQRKGAKGLNYAQFLQRMGDEDHFPDFKPMVLMEYHASQFYQEPKKKAH